VKAAVTRGLLDEALMPYVPGDFKHAPTPEQLKLALAHKVTSYHAIANGDLNGMKHAMVQGFGVVFGFECYDYMLGQEMARTGILKLPGVGEHYQGGHCVLMVGYNDSVNMVLCKNSWSAKWGQNGYFWMPYAYIVSRRLASDFWVVQSADIEPQAALPRAA
jgi:C1A family cysteine protease